MSFQVGNIGIVLRFTVKDQAGTVVDISSATVLQIVLVSPSGARTVKTGVLTTNGTDGKVQYTTASASELNENGLWRAQVYLQGVSGFTGYSSIDRFQVIGNL